MKKLKPIAYFIEIRKRIDRKRKLEKIKKLRSFYFACINSEDSEFIKKRIDQFFNNCNYYRISVRDGFSCTVNINSSEGNFSANAFFNFNAFKKIIEQIYKYNIQSLKENKLINPTIEP